MSTQSSQTARWKHIEPLLAVSLVLLKLNVLRLTWGRLQGYDPAVWLDVLRLTRWFEPQVSPRAFYGSFHPPLSYLLGRSIFNLYPHEVEASQILSTLSMLGAFFALRSLVRRIGFLHTLPGLWLLYGSMSMPVFVWLAQETANDAILFLWFAMALAFAVSLFWAAVPAQWWKNARFSWALTLLGLVYAAGMLTKFNMLVAMGLPVLVILVRRGLRAAYRELVPPLVAAVIGITVIFPVFYTRYYLTEGTFMPASMEWMRSDTIDKEIAKRNADPLKYLANMLRIPEKSVASTHTPLLDSFIHSEWLQIWKRDSTLFPQPELSSSFSNFYVDVFPTILGIGTLLFLVRNRRMVPAWRDLGWVLLVIAVTFCAAAISFAWKYPVWDWRVFKAKYNSPAVLWIPYATTVALGELLNLFASRWLANAAFWGLVVFMMANHLLPVY